MEAEVPRSGRDGMSCVAVRRPFPRSPDPHAPHSYWGGRLLRLAEIFAEPVVNLVVPMGLQVHRRPLDASRKALDRDAQPSPFDGSYTQVDWTDKDAVVAYYDVREKEKASRAEVLAEAYRRADMSSDEE